jgi:hypothetical protein
VWQLGSWDDWIDTLETDEHGRKVLTLERAIAMAGRGHTGGWYIGPVDGQYTIGRIPSGDREQRVPVVSEGKPVLFNSVAEAREFLRHALGVTPAVPRQIQFS